MYLYSITACEMEESRRIIGNEREDYVNASIEKKQKDLLRSLRGIQEAKEIRQEYSRNVITTQCFPNRSTHFTTPVIAFRSTLAPITAFRITQTHQNPKSFDIAMLYPLFTSFCNFHTQTLSQKPRQRTSTQFIQLLTPYCVKILPARVLPSLALNHTRSIEHRTTTNSTHPIHANTAMPSLPKIAIFRTERVVEPIARRTLHYQSCFTADLTHRPLIANQRFGNRLHDLDTTIAQLV